MSDAGDFAALEWQLPYLTAGLPGIGGRLRVTPEDFRVEEVPAYAPCGEGEHTFFAVEKWDLSTPLLVQEIAAALEISPHGVSYAGLKDARAVTQQVFSVQWVDPEVLLSLRLENARVLWAARHTNKLRVGHLRGNRFSIRIRDVSSQAEARAAAILELLARRGVPNGYGVQRFGNDGRNAEIGWLLLRNDRAALRARGIQQLPYRQHRFFLSALQSALFNRYLAERLRRGLLDEVLPGDVAKKHATGGMFTVEAAAAERPRVQAGEISATGPIYGYKLWPAQGEAAALEAAILAAAGLQLEDFRPAKLKGSRRPVRYLPEELTWRCDGDVFTVEFFAPKGAFATMLLRELLKAEAEPDETAEAEEEAE